MPEASEKHRQGDGEDRQQADESALQRTEIVTNVHGYLRRRTRRRRLSGQEANTALRVLLKRREMDKRELEEQVLYNVKELVQPYLDKLKLDAKDIRNKAFISIIESNLNDITSAFSRRLAIDFYDLTKSELKVASFIRQGKRSHQIADILGLSVRTVEAYRNSIRRKLRIKKRKINLRTFLLSIS